MEILDKSEALLTNAEVAEALRENGKMGREASRAPVVLEMEKRVRQYIEGTTAKAIKTDEVAALYRRLESFEPLVRVIAELGHFACFNDTCMFMLMTFFASAEQKLNTLMTIIIFFSGLKQVDKTIAWLFFG